MTNKLSAGNALKFMLAGKAYVTFRSVKTQTRYTYRLVKAKDRDLWFVSLLIGPENSTSYSYLGVIQNNSFRLTPKSRLPITSVPVKAFKWVFDKLVKGVEPPDVEIWHEGRCGRCGRLLTVPESIERGIGPECAGVMGIADEPKGSAYDDFNDKWAQLKNEFAKREAKQEQLAFMEGL